MTRMLVNLPAAVVDADPANLEEMSGFLARLGVEVVARLPAVEQLGAVLGAQRQPQLVVVNLDPEPHEMLGRLSPLVQRHGQIDFFVMSESVDPQLLMDAMHLGVKEFIALPVQPDRLKKGVERASRARRSASSQAKVITFIPTCGGCGATTAACNVAVTLAKKGRTALIDLDLSGGTVAEALDLRPRFSIADVTGGRLDRQLVDNALLLHKPSSLSVLARPEVPEDGLRVDAAGLNRLLTTMADGLDYIVIDSVLSVAPLWMAAVKGSDVVVLVVQLTVPSIRNATRYLGALRRMGVEVGDGGATGSVRVIANRFAKRGNEVTPEAAEKALGMKLSWMIPNDYRNASAATNYGEPIVLRSPRAEMSASLGQLAHMLNGRVPGMQKTDVVPAGNAGEVGSTRE